MKLFPKTILACALLCAGAASAQESDNDPRSMGGGNCSANPYNCEGVANPLPAATTIWIEDMTWMEVRDAMANGKTTAIVPAGGIEPNGPWAALGKHDYIMKLQCESIARRLGNALCAPVIAYVPQGNIDAKEGFMKSPGTMGVTKETYEALVTDIARALKTHGFKRIVLIGDHAGDVKGMENAAAKLREAWKGAPAIAYIPEFYKSWDGAVDLLHAKGVGKKGVVDGLHDDPTVTTLMMLYDPKTVRWDERRKLGKLSIDGVSVANKKQALAWGRELLEYRTRVTVEAIDKAFLPAPTGSSP